MQLEPTKKYKVELSGEEIGLVQYALAKLPYEVSANLIHDLPNRIKLDTQHEDEHNTINN